MVLNVRGIGILLRILAKNVPSFAVALPYERKESIVDHYGRLGIGPGALQ